MCWDHATILGFFPPKKRRIVNNTKEFFAAHIVFIIIIIIALFALLVLILTFTSNDLETNEPEEDPPAWAHREQRTVDRSTLMFFIRLHVGKQY